MLTNLYFAGLALACLYALSNWRGAVYLAIALDFARDPVRKLDPNESIYITVSVLGLWGIITLSAWSQSQASIQIALRSHPKLLKAFKLLVAAIIPGSAISLILYSQGYKLVALGVVSYLAPSAGVLLGLVLPRSGADIRRLLRFYCIVNGAALSGVVFEYLEMPIAGLGGMKGMEWIRHSGNEIVDLIGGFYRSPDIMGLHAAQVVMFCLILTVNRPGKTSFAWIALAIFGGVCLVLSGRRKMLGMPLVWGACFSLLCYLRGVKRFDFVAIPIAGIAAAFVGTYLVTTQEFVENEYANYATTLFTNGADRSQELVSRSIRGTLYQSGVLGSGLGSSTQGNYHVVGSHVAKGWQEDGISRLFKELGIIGVILACASGVTLLGGLRDSAQRVPLSGSDALLQLMLFSVVVANLASFIISHQQYSGDPPSALIVLLVLGMALAVVNYPARIERTRH